MSLPFDPATLLGLLATASLKGAWAIFLVMLVRTILRRRMPRRWHYALWTLVAVRLVMPIGPMLPSSVVPAAAADGVRFPGLEGLALAGAGAAGEPHRAADAAFSWTAAVLGLWLLGVCFLLFRDAVARRQLRALIRQAEPVHDAEQIALLRTCRKEMDVARSVDLLTTGALASPALLPGRRPAILLPEAAARQPDLEQLRYVFLHELAHLRQRDGMVEGLTRLLVALHWFNPAVHWAARRSRRDREAACDERVVDRLPSAARRGYGLALLETATAHVTTPSTPGLVAMADSPNGIERRIQMIAHYKKTRRIGLIVPTLAFLGAALLGWTELPARAEESAEAGAALNADIDALKTSVHNLREAGRTLYGQWVANHGVPVNEIDEELTEIDWDQCPTISWQSLAAELGLEPVDALPAEDGWGHPLELCFHEVVAEGGSRLTLGIRAPGRDGTFEGPVYAIGSFPNDELDQDVVWMDGYFIRWPAPQ